MKRAGGELPSVGGLMPLNSFMEEEKTSVCEIRSESSAAEGNPPAGNWRTRRVQETVCPCLKALH